MKQDKSTTEINKKLTGFSDEERAAMKERAQELKAVSYTHLTLPTIYSV